MTHLTRPEAIAERLGVPQEAVRDVQRRGFLRHFDLDEVDIRRRLWQCHAAYVAGPDRPFDLDRLSTELPPEQRSVGRANAAREGASMRLITLTVSLASALILSLALTAGGAARPFDPAPGPPAVASTGETCPSTAASAAVVPGGVYRAMVDELREAGYSHAEIRAELGSAEAAPVSGLRTSGAARCTTQNP